MVGAPGIQSFASQRVNTKERKGRAKNGTEGNFQYIKIDNCRAVARPLFLSLGRALGFWSSSYKGYEKALIAVGKYVSAIRQFGNWWELFGVRASWI